MIYVEKSKYIIILILFIIFNNPSHAFQENSYFVGHPYGYHGNKDIPDKSLKNFFKKNPPVFILFGGDMTENENDFQIFYQYFKKFNFLAVRGNHDGDLFSKIPCILRVMTFFITSSVLSKFAVVMVSLCLSVYNPSESVP